MCRLVLMNKSGEKEIEKNYGLENYFKFLENSFGGNGNGYALLRKGKIIEINKGVKLSVRDIAKTIRKKNYDWCIFHTRLASVGKKCDSNCHPFIRNNNEVIAMNGTENKIDFLSKPLEKTDTELILDVKVTYNLELPALTHFNSIFVGFSKGKPYVVADNTYNIRLLRNVKKNAIVFASEFPESMKKNIYSPKDTFIWNGEEIDMTNFISYRKIKEYQRNLFNYSKPFLAKDNEDDLETVFINQEKDEFDYYSDFYKEYDKELEKYNKEGERYAA